ncbi:uncharacterized protein LOC143572141 isoform X1 [Bidens hawaiensis]|uniref:uncharacterized protein LOC143572141 isoform X1 n=1 Tax=Bidens hawaiensis TaxID=980011 RepID=UPI00404A87DA
MVQLQPMIMLKLMRTGKFYLTFFFKNRLKLNLASNVEFCFHLSSDIYRVWQEAPILVIVSTLAYFCFLEQFLCILVKIAEKMGKSSIAISLPFSCILGLLSSMTSTAMAKRRLVWVYASVQFAFVGIFAYIFSSVVKRQPMLSIVLAAFAGCGAAICCRSIVVGALRLRRWWRRMSNQQRDSSTLEIAPPSPLVAFDTPPPPSFSPPPPPSYATSLNDFPSNSPQLEVPSPLPTPAPAPAPTPTPPTITTTNCRKV